MTWPKTKLETDINQFKRLVGDASIIEVDEPKSCRFVEVVYETDTSFEELSGDAYGVYADPNWQEPEKYHIDWTSGDRTTVTVSNIVTFEMGNWKSVNS